MSGDDEIEELNIVKLSREEFSLWVKEYVARNGAEYMEAILKIAEERKLEIEAIPRLLTADLRDLLRDEAASLNLLKGEKAADKLEFTIDIQWK